MWVWVGVVKPVHASSPVSGGKSGKGNLTLCRALNGNPCTRNAGRVILTAGPFTLCHGVPLSMVFSLSAMLQKAQCCGCVRALQTQQCWVGACVLAVRRASA